MTSALPSILRFGLRKSYSNHHISSLSLRHCVRACHVGRQNVTGQHGINELSPTINDTVGIDMPVDMPFQDAIVEPTLASLGLCGYTPAGLVQRVMEFLHISCDLPWWGVIATTAVIARTCLFPFVVMQRRGMVKYMNGMYDAAGMTMEITRARNEKDTEKFIRLLKERDEMMKNIPVKQAILVPALAQGGTHSSIFFALHGMTGVPVESLRTGGLSWFQDLVLPDPFYLLPLLGSLTILVALETGAESGGQKPSKNIQKFLRIMVPVFFLFTMKFESAVVLYFCTNNIITLIQANLFRHTRLKELCGIGDVKARPEGSPDAGSMLDFKKGLHEAMENARIVHDMEERQRLEAKKRQNQSKKEE